MTRIKEMKIKICKQFKNVEIIIRNVWKIIESDKNNFKNVKI